MTARWSDEESGGDMETMERMIRSSLFRAYIWLFHTLRSGSQACYSTATPSTYGRPVGPAQVCRLLLATSPVVMATSDRRAYEGCFFGGVDV